MSTTVSDTSTNRGPTEQLADFLASIEIEDVPLEVLERSNHLALDGIACLLIGAHLPWSEPAVHAIRKLEGSGCAVVAGWDLKLPPTSAALLNGTFIQGFEIDDYHEHGPLHSESIVLPAAFATVDAVGTVSGRQLALGLLVGFEAGPRMGIAMDAYAMINHGWHCGSVIGVVSAAAAAGKIRDLDAEQFEDALGIVATQASGLMSAQYESMVKRMNHAFSARAGVVAAALAAEGYVGIKRVFEREFGGFFAAFCADHPTDIGAVTRDLGTQWELMRIIVKPYASGGTTHPVADAMLIARNELGVTPENLKSVIVRMPEAPFKHNGWKPERPATPIGAQISAGFVGAVMLVDGEAFVRQFSPTRINAEDVWSVLDRIELIHDPEMDVLARETNTPRATRVDITLVNGAEHHLEILEAKGTGKRILTNEEIRDKYRILMASIMGPERAKRIEELTLNLHELKDARELIDLLGPSVKSPFE
jgi:2-methylcitrate dehydratase PrpD